MAGAISHPRRVDSISWALFFIWIGIAVLWEIDWGWSLLGTSAIVLGTQAFLYLGGEKADGFWVICGLVILAAGVWELAELTWPLAPVMLVLLGLVMLGNSLFGRQPR